LLEGPHRFPSKAGGIVRGWIQRVWPLMNANER
jgi:hypothetical protein